MKFKEFRTIQLTSVPAIGDNPPENTVYEWFTNFGLAAQTLNYRYPDGSERIVAGGGQAGASGASGATGVIGYAGATGVGLQGDQGPAGATGPGGGDPGASGASGATGARGATGTGISGATGATGPLGASGATGPSGGPVGASGASGATGSIGATGPLGGPPGATGATGIAGATGLIGVQGSSGIRGATGIGLVGATGIPGTTGPEGSSATTGNNVIINGGFDFFQRNNNTGWNPLSVADDTYCFDRWIGLTESNPIQAIRWNDATGTSSQPGPFVGLITNNSASQRMGLLQIVEGCNSFPLRGQTITLQATAWTGFTGLSTPFALRYAVLEWTGVADTVTSDVVRDWNSGTFTPNNFFLSSNLVVAATGTITPPNAWTTITLSATISQACNNLIVFFWTESPVATNALVELKNVDCHTGSVRVWSPRPIGEELALCQRYYEKSYGVDTKPGTAGPINGVVCMQATTTAGIMGTKFRVTKRAFPAVHPYSMTNGAIDYITEMTQFWAYVADRAGTVSVYGADSFLLSCTGGPLTPTNLVTYQWTCEAEL